MREPDKSDRKAGKTQAILSAIIFRGSLALLKV
jgi:hypothetical protein